MAGWWFQTCFMFHFIYIYIYVYGMSSQPHWRSLHIFQDGWSTTNQILIYNNYGLWWFMVDQTYGISYDWWWLSHQEPDGMILVGFVGAMSSMDRDG